MTVSDPAKNARLTSARLLVKSQWTDLNHCAGWRHDDVENPALSRPGRNYVADESTRPTFDTEGIN